MGGTARVDLARAAHLSAADADAIVAATEELLRDGEVSIVDVTGPIDVVNPPGGWPASSGPYFLLRSGGTVS